MTNKLDSYLSNNIELYLFDESGRCIYYYDINNKDHKPNEDSALITGFLKAIMSFSKNFEFGNIKDTFRIIRGNIEIRVPHSSTIYGALKINNTNILDEKTLEKTDVLLNSIMGRLMLDHSDDLTKFITDGGTEGLCEISNSIEQAIIKNKLLVYTDYLRQILKRGVKYGVESKQLGNILKGLEEEYHNFNSNYTNAALNGNKKIINELKLVRILDMMQNFNDRVRDVLSNNHRLINIINEINADSTIWRLFKVPLITK